MSIRSRLEIVENKIAQACARSGRERSSVLLIAVSKTKPIEDIQEVYKAGCRTFGENRVQELLQKASAVDQPLSWHLIGHLQVNKVKYLPGMATMIHSVDSEKLAQEIDRQAQKHQLKIDVLCEVNIAGEESKFGIAPEQIPEFVKRISESCPNLNLKGLMTVAPRTSAPEENRVYFRRMKQLLMEANAALPANRQMTELSMGMSGDYEVAIEEGATMIRIGSAIFGSRNYDVN